MKSMLLVSSCGRIELAPAPAPLVGVKLQAFGILSTSVAVWSSGVSTWSKTVVHQGAFDIATCLAAVSRLALTSLDLTARPLTGGLSWKTASPIVHTM